MLVFCITLLFILLLYSLPPLSLAVLYCVAMDKTPLRSLLSPFFPLPIPSIFFPPLNFLDPVSSLYNAYLPYTSHLKCIDFETPSSLNIISRNKVCCGCRQDAV